MLGDQGRMTTTSYLFLFIPVFLLSVNTAIAQVEIKQSVTTNDNEQTTSIKTESGSGNISTIEKKMKVLALGTVELINKPGRFKIHYRGENNACHSYKVEKNETLIKEN